MAHDDANNDQTQIKLMEAILKKLDVLEVLVSRVDHLTTQQQVHLLTLQQVQMEQQRQRATVPPPDTRRT